MKDYKDLFMLTGKTAYIAGGLGVIGSEISRAFMQAGAKTIILDKKKHAGETFALQQRKLGFDVMYEYMDVTALEDIDKSIARLCKKYGSPDVWVNTAYPKTSDWGADIDHVSLRSWRKNTDMQLISYCWISRCVCQVMKKQKRGSLINLGSMYGVLGNDSSLYERTKTTAPPAYAAIKGGIANMTRYLASFFGRYQVRVNTLCPGGVHAHQDKAFVRKYIAKTPLRRMAEPRDVAAAALFLASDASSYITGTTFMVDGGFSSI
jgi:NAD(P)-dependent dehydrogenase (short-subunit alcohol dehydrogenase family)